ncbi:hypothetical protein V5P93_005151 [Actinokineospora auranticolor]|uniref:hypothetical protein n=1 Tax=Actinokineospora auranticolor TaxID=155976 RepID=UPI0015E39CDC|nr:hypothetical protein [Actinokineospora auranticolor]
MPLGRALHVEPGVERGDARRGEPHPAPAAVGGVRLAGAQAPVLPGRQPREQGAPE